MWKPIFFSPFFFFTAIGNSWLAMESISKRGEGKEGKNFDWQRRLRISYQRRNDCKVEIIKANNMIH
jgi:hypothetical protein